MRADPRRSRRRPVLRGVALALLVISPLWLGACGEDDATPVGEPATVALPVQLRDDPRIAEIPLDCTQLGPFVGDTADVVGILVRKLVKGDSEVIHRAAEELGAMGATILPTLERLLLDQMHDPKELYALHNTLSALAHNPEPGATELLLAAFNHPQYEIRSQVLGILAKRAIPPQYFELLQDAAEYESGNARLFALSALFACDAARAGALLLDWIEAGRIPGEPEAWGKLLATIDDPATLERLERSYTTVPDALLPWIEVALFAHAGDAAMRERIELRLGLGDPAERGAVLIAALAAGSFELVAEIARTDRSSELRLLALQGLAAHTKDEFAPIAVPRLAAALDDPSPEVRFAVQDALVRAGHADATDRAIAMLQGDRRDLEAALPALHAAMLANPALIERVRTAIRRQLGDPERSDARRDVHLLQALALCPGEESARYVLDVGLSAAADATIEGLRAHRFLAIQAANTGPEGRAFVAERLAGETDPVRRLDLLWCIASDRDDTARAALIALVEQDGIDPWERLYVASLLARTGPTGVVAPVLKGVARRMEGEPRRALDCLLWRWY